MKGFLPIQGHPFIASCCLLALPVQDRRVGPPRVRFYASRLVQLCLLWVRPAVAMASTVRGMRVVCHKAHAKATIRTDMW
jgi:hypothetical protein